MRILPPVTEPWGAKIVRRHEPKPATGQYGHRKYRPCLRWEFGFSCAFCLCHEVDLALCGRSEIEHFTPVSYDPEQKNLYSNCFLVCPFCNRSRGVAPNQDPRGSGRLLNPCEVAWEEVFALEEDELLSPEENPDAVYTTETYDLNDPDRRTMRQLRRAVAAAYQAFRGRAQKLRERLHTRAVEKGDPELLDMAEEMWSLNKPINEFLRRYDPVPWNADTSCRCGHTRHHSLPEVLERQLMEIDL